MVEILSKKHYDARLAENLEDAKKMILEMIPEGASVALGGSATLEQVDFLSAIRAGNYNFLDRYEKGLKYDPDILAIHKKSLTADCYIAGINAITENGELVNVDCTGNRVAAMIFGPKKVILIAGTNKLVKDLNAAMERLKMIAPINSKRIKHVTPCLDTGYCVDCDCKQRMCNYTTIIHNGQKVEGRISIIIVPGAFGF